VGGGVPRQSIPEIVTLNTLGRARQRFESVSPGRATIYTCGPTVYRYAHIGNLRSYLMADWLRRLLEAQGYVVTQVKNITDVGHMRQDMLERGEDKVLAAALAAGRTPQEIAQFYTDAFLEDERKLNILPAHEFPRATDNIGEMVDITRTLVDRGYAYVVEGNVYFEVAKFPEYGKLSGQRGGGLEEGVRVEVDPLKRDQRDFALWKAAEPGRELKWPSPWGDGFPGWHIECSAMSARYLGSLIDFHTGGVDNIFPHHEDEIAQSESAFGTPHVRTWMHGQHLLVDGLKMAKSTGNVYTVSDLARRGYDPLAFRYLCATAHYRARLNFTWASLKAAQTGLDRLRQRVLDADGRVTKKARQDGERMRHAFWSAAMDDLGVPRALAIAWKTAGSSLPGEIRRELLMDFDRFLGLDLVGISEPGAVPREIEALLARRAELRAAASFAEADALRAEVLDAGYEVRDGRAGTVVLALPEWKRGEAAIAGSDDVDSKLDEPGELPLTVCIVARQGCEELTRCLVSVRRFLPDAEVLVVDNGFEDECGHEIDKLVAHVSRARVFHADHYLGWAAGANVGLRQARGRSIVFIDTSVELSGDVLSGLNAMLSDETVGVAGRWGVVSRDLRSFEEVRQSGDVDAVEGYLMAFRRDVLQEVGLQDEKYRFYRHLDLDFSFNVRSRGYRAVIDTTLPVVKHEHVEWSATPPLDRDRLSKRNYYRFLQKWGDRTDLLTSASAPGR
jgi:cysteinyl-tRNA synthetase